MNDTGTPTFRTQLRHILFLTAIFFLNFLARIILAPLMPAVEEDLGVGHGEAGSLFLLISVGYFVTLTSSGFFSSRLMHRRTIALAAAAVGVSLVGISFSNSIWAVRLAFLMLGMAAGLYLPSAIATLTTLVGAPHWGKAMAVHELAPNLGFVAAPLVCEALLLWFSWRGIFAFLGVSSILLGIAFVRFGSGGRFAGEAPGLASSRSLFVQPSFWIMMALFSLGITGTLGVYTMLPLYLVAERSINRNWANTLIAFSRLPALGMTFFSGWVTDRWGPTRALRGVFLLTGLVTLLLGMLPDSWIVIMVFLQPLIAACFFPPGFAALSSIGPPSARNVAVSLTVPVSFIIGGGVVPTLIGVMGDMGSFGLGIAMVGGLILTGFLISLYLKFPNEVL